jgi:hypothetical protein
MQGALSVTQLDGPMPVKTGFGNMYGAVFCLSFFSFCEALAGEVGPLLPTYR